MILNTFEIHKSGMIPKQVPIMPLLDLCMVSKPTQDDAVVFSFIRAKNFSIPIAIGIATVKIFNEEKRKKKKSGT